MIGALDQRDFARMIPGLTMVDSGARNGIEFVLRGLTTGDNSGTLGQTTTTYVDDAQVDLYYRPARSEAARCRTYRSAARAARHALWRRRHRRYDPLHLH